MKDNNKMNGDRYIDRARLRGYMLECAVSRLLEENGFREITDEQEGKIRIDRVHFTELKGRGEWHQIDCPCEYNIEIPFINKIRLLAEVKFFKGKIEKNLIREYIGVLKDIQENYFVEDGISISLLGNRFTELGVYFSASGFTDSSERLAFAHNIKTVSYENVEVIGDIISDILEIEENYLRTGKCISKGKQGRFISSFRKILSNQDSEEELRTFIEEFEPAEADGFRDAINLFKEHFSRIKCNFFANTSGGALLHFISDREFPDYLFQDTDIAEVEIYHQSEIFYLIFSMDNERRKFYFKPPKSLGDAVYARTSVLGEKERHFKSLTLTRIIKGIKRTITLRLNNDWLQNARESNDSI